MNKMNANARVTKVSDREVVHSSVGAAIVVLVGRRVQESWLVVTRELGKGKWEIKHDRAESLLPATEQGSPRFLGEHAAACRGCAGCSERGTAPVGLRLVAESGTLSHTPTEASDAATPPSRSLKVRDN